MHLFLFLWGSLWLRRGFGISFRCPFLFGLFFLFVRILYTVLSAFAPLPFAFDSGGHMVPVASRSPLKAFSATSGSWAVYLVMSVLAEYSVVLIYTFAGLRLPLKQDLADYQKAGMHMRTMSEEALTEHAAAQPYDPAYSQQYSQAYSR